MDSVRLRAIKKSYDPADHTFEFIANSGGLDRDGEILVPEGCDFANWMKNPLILWAHDDWSLPVAKGLELQADKKDGLVGKGLFASEHTGFAAAVEEMWAAEFINALSVRFIPRKWEDYAEGSDEFKSGLYRRYTEWELLEISVVDIPCDPNAVRKAFEGRREHDLRQMLRSATAIQAGLDLTFDDKKSEPRTKRVVPFKEFPLADDDTTWSFSAADGNEIIEKGGWKFYKQCHTWQDADLDPETRQAYKLPHHKIIHDAVKTIWRGCAAAMAVVLGARGGIDISDDERRQCYNHLAKEYKRFEKPVPEFKQYGPIGAAMAAFGIEGTEEMLKAIEPYVRKGCALELGGDDLLAILEGSYDDSGSGAAPDAEGKHLFGPDIDTALVETLGVISSYFGGDGKSPSTDTTQ